MLEFFAFIFRSIHERFGHNTDIDDITLSAHSIPSLFSYLAENEQKYTYSVRVWERDSNSASKRTNERSKLHRTNGGEEKRGKRNYCSLSLCSGSRDARPYIIGRVFTAVNWKPLLRPTRRGVMAYAEIDVESLA